MLLASSVISIYIRMILCITHKQGDIYYLASLGKTGIIVCLLILFRYLWQTYILHTYMHTDRWIKRQMNRQTQCQIETDGQTATNTIRQTLILADTYRLRGRAKIGPSVSKNKKIRSELTWKVLPLETIFTTQIYCWHLSCMFYMRRDFPNYYCGNKIHK